MEGAEGLAERGDGESFRAFHAAGIALILAGVWLAGMASAREAPSPARAEATEPPVA